MAEKITLQVQKRTSGQNARALRNGGFLPAVIYGRGYENIPISIAQSEFLKAYKIAGESTLIYVKLENEEFPILVYDLQHDPIKDTILHADLYRVRLDEKITASIPLVFKGESSAVKDLNGTLIKNAKEVEVEALPMELPHELSIDLGKLKDLGDDITVRDIPLPSGVEITSPPQDEVVVTVKAPRTEEELEALEEKPTEDVEQVEVGEKKEEETEKEEGKEREVDTKGANKEKE